MRFANLNGRAVLLAADATAENLTGYDVEAGSGRKFGPDPGDVFDQWELFTDWAGTFEPTQPPTVYQREQLGPPSPTPGQIIAIGLNYREHVAESGLSAPTGLPPVFTKFRSSLSGPISTVALPRGGHTDWEVELVVVIGRTSREVPEAAAWSHVAGLTVGQDLSERITQLQGTAPQFGLGKSFAGFTPTGPWLVTVDELESAGHVRDDLALGCAVDGVELQRARTSELIYSVPRLISELSTILTLQPGDLIFTGTPAGVGLGRQPQRFLRAGEQLTSWVAGIGELEQTFVDA
ncbi:fumarylacetoacetate hydrolase family protein [Kribbella sp. NPDC055071]